MEMIPVNYDELKRIKKDETGQVTKFIEMFVESCIECVEVVDVENCYNNNNDLNTALRGAIKRGKDNKFDEKVKTFMLNGKVYLKRK